MQYLELFNRTYVESAPIKGITYPRDTNYIKDIYSHNLNKIIEYYHDKNFAIKNTFILSRILENISINLSTPPDKYYDYLREYMPYLGRHYRFTSEIEKGIVHYNTFFASNTPTIIINLDDYHNPYKVISEWEYYNCIEMIKHPVNDINMLLPTGKNYGSRGGLAVVGVNLPVLAMKYREFLRKQLYNEASGQAVLNKNHFIYKYVLGPAMKSMIDHTFVNMLMDRFYHNEQIVPHFKHPFAIFKPMTQINRFLDDTLNIITNKNLNFIDILANIQVPVKLNALDLMVLPDVAPTSQIKWAMFLSRLDIMLFLIDVSKNKTASTTFINHWKTLSKRVASSGHYLDLFDYNEANIILEKIKRLTNE